MNRRSFFACLAGLAGWLGLAVNKTEFSCVAIPDVSKLRPALSPALITGVDDFGIAKCCFIEDGKQCGPEFTIENLGCEPLRAGMLVWPSTDLDGRWYARIIKTPA